MSPAYTLFYDRQYLDDLERIDPFDIPIIRGELLLLEHQAEQQTRNRRPLRVPIPWCPAATWQVRVRGYRLLYSVQEGVVTVLRLRFKGSATTEDMGP